MRHIVMTATALLVLAGCGGAAPEANRADKAGAAQAPITSADGRSEVRADADFSGLPEGIPAYPRVSGAGAVQMGGASEEGEMRIMAFRTADPPATVIAFYADAASRAGFREARRARSGASEVLGLERANGEVVQVTATAAAGATSVQFMIGRGRPRR
jgi:hypothetical protein